MANILKCKDCGHEDEAHKFPIVGRVSDPDDDNWSDPYCPMCHSTAIVTKPEETKMIDEGQMQKEVPKPFHARVKKTLYITGELHHHSDCEVVTEEVANELLNLYVKEGTTGTYYPDDSLFVTDDYLSDENEMVHDEYGIGPEHVERMVACSHCDRYEIIYMQGMCKHCFITLAAEAEASRLIEDDPFHAAQLLSEILTVFAYGKEEKMLFSTAIDGSSLKNCLKKVKGDSRLCKHFDQIERQCAYPEDMRKHKCEGMLGNCVVEKYCKLHDPGEPKVND